MRGIFRFAGFALLALVLAGGVAVALTWVDDVPVEALKARWAPAPSTFVALDGMQVHVRDEGPRDDPEPIVLLHGTSASLHTWDGWAAALRGGRRVVRFDLPGFGLTGPDPRGDYSEAAYVRFVLRMLDALGLQRVTLGGNSLGGAIAWQTAAAAPGRIARLVLVDAGGYAFEPTSVPLGFRLARLPLARDLMAHVLPRAVIESSVRNVYGDPGRVTPELVDRYFAMTARAGNRAALVRRMTQLTPGRDIGRLRTLSQPTLVLWGGRDRLIPPDNARRFAADIAGSRLVVFDDLGHVPHEEDPRRTVEAVLQFLATPAPPSAAAKG